MTAEGRKIWKQKTEAFGNKVLFLLCGRLPIRRDKITICAYGGKGGYCCNPKYIVEELHIRNPKLRFVWFVNSRRKKFPKYVRKVKNNAWNRAWHLSTSKIWIDNDRKPYGTVKREGQYYIQTWHGTVGIKGIGLWQEETSAQMSYLVSKSDSDMIDYVLTDSKWSEEMFSKGLLYDGDFLRIGAPRCDILCGDRSCWGEEIREKFHLPEEARIALFAPAVRENSRTGTGRTGSAACPLDYERLLKNLEKKFGGKWYLGIRLHPRLVSKIKKLEKAEVSKHIFAADIEADENELLAGVDACITDYSSIAGDAGFGKVPVFLYADDLMESIYAGEEMQWEFHEDFREPIVNNKKMTHGIAAVLPFPMARNNDELETNIVKFDEKEYVEGIERFAKKIELVFDGMAGMRAADKIEELLDGGI